MSAQERQVLWGSPKHWQTSAPVGSHGFAREFAARDWQVLFVSSPITPFHRCLASDPKLYRERKVIHQAGGEWHEGSAIWDYVPWSFLPSKQFPRCWLAASLGDIDRAWRLTRQQPVCPHIVWIDNPEFGPFFTQYPQAIHILRIADRNQGLNSFNSRLLRYQPELAQQADLIIVTSFALEEEFRRLGFDNLLRVPNGVNLRQFQPDALPQPPADLPQEGRPVAIFAGMIDNWFDMDLLTGVATRLPDVFFLLIGRIGIALREKKLPKNIRFLGERPAEMIPAYLYHAAVGIIPFKRNDFTAAINPVKYYEYLAAGLPVVASDLEELRRGEGPVLLAADTDAFANHVRQALTLPGSYRKLCREAAKAASWANRWETVMQRLEQMAPKRR